MSCDNFCTQNISKSYEQIFIKFSGGLGHMPRRNLLDFGGNVDSLTDPDSFLIVVVNLLITVCG